MHLNSRKPQLSHNCSLRHNNYHLIAQDDTVLHMKENTSYTIKTVRITYSFNEMVRITYSFNEMVRIITTAVIISNGAFAVEPEPLL